MPLPFDEPTHSLSVPPLVADPLVDLQRFARLHERMFGGTRAMPLVGRYELGCRLGEGGSGFVHRGYDPTLRRAVAIKVIPLPDHVTGARRDELMSEAHVLASLDHPHLVRVYDAGVCHLVDTRRPAELPASLMNSQLLYMVMELVEGQLLHQWLKSGRLRAEILSAFFVMGEALAMAHALGVVHRDLKPANIALDGEGQPKVLDFGLAGVGMVASDDQDDALILGTPAYMAPEQHEGRVGDSRADQFSFCVTLWEALAGVRPYRGPTLDDYRIQKLGARPAAGGRLPRAMREVLERGLAPEPDRRWRDMPTLLAALRRVRRRWSVARTVAGIGAVVATAGIASAVALSESVEPCETDGASRITTLWSAESRARLTTALERRAPLRANELTGLINGRFDRLARAWAEEYDRVCMQPAAARTEALKCLEGVEAAALGVLQALEHNPGPGVVQVLGLLPEPADCGREDQGESSRLAAHRRELMEYRSRAILGELEPVLHHAETVLASGSVPVAVRAEWSLIRGLCLTSLRRAVDAREALEQALVMGEQARDPRMSVSALLGLASLMFGSDPEQARVYLELADSHRESLGLRMRVSLDAAWALYQAQVERDLEAALERWNSVVDHLVEGDAPPHMVMACTSGIASVLIRLGRFEDADEQLGRLLDHIEPREGNEGLVTILQVHRGFNNWMRGDLEAAAQDLTHAGPYVWPLDIAFALEIHAKASIDRGQFEEIEARMAAARERSQLEPARPDPTIIAQASLDLYRGRFSRATPLPDEGGFPGRDWEQELLAGHAAVVDGRLAEARRAVAVVEDKALRMTEYGTKLLYLDTAELAASLGDADLCMRLLEFVVAGPSPQLRARAHLLGARMALVVGRDAQADEQLQLAGRQLAELERPWVLGEVEHALLGAVRLARAGDEAMARSLAVGAMERRGARHSLALARAASLLAAAPGFELAQLARTWVRELGDELGTDHEVIEWLIRERPARP